MKAGYSGTAGDVAASSNSRRSRSYKESEVLLDQRLVHRPMLRIELVEQLDEKPVAALELCTGGQIDLSREPLILSLELLDQILVQRD